MDATGIPPNPAFIHQEYRLKDILMIAMWPRSLLRPEDLSDRCNEQSCSSSFASHPATIFTSFFLAQGRLGSQKNDLGVRFDVPQMVVAKLAASMQVEESRKSNFSALAPFAFKLVIGRESDVPLRRRIKQSLHQVSEIKQGIGQEHQCTIFLPIHDRPGKPTLILVALKFLVCEMHNDACEAIEDALEKAAVGT